MSSPVPRVACFSRVPISPTCKRPDCLLTESRRAPLGARAPPSIKSSPTTSSQPPFGAGGMEAGDPIPKLHDLRLDTSIRDFGAHNTPTTNVDGAPPNTNMSGNGWMPEAHFTATNKYSAAEISARSRSLLWVDQNGAPTEQQEQLPTAVQGSPIDNYLLNRRPPITFDPHGALDSGYRQSMDEPLQKPMKTRPRGRSLLQALSDEKSRLQALSEQRCRSARAHSESDRTHYNPITGQPLPKYADRTSENQQPHVGDLRHPLLQSTVDELARGSPIALASSPMSQAPISPASDKVRPPQDQRDFFLSPTAPSPPQYPASYEETNLWQRNRRAFDRGIDRAQTADFAKRNGSMRTAFRRSSRRSTSSSTKSPGSAASSWLRGFYPSSGPESAVEALSPESEGQTIGYDYVLGRQIGFGGFSTIHEVTQMVGSAEQRKLAAKIVRKVVKDKSMDENEQFQAEFGHEVELWRLLHHPHILPLETVWHTDEATYCFIPLSKGGTLFDLVRSNRSGVPTDLAKRYSYQLAVALRYLHRDARVAHRDVKLENCVLDTTPNPAELRLCDFGMAEWISNDKDSNGSGPPSPSINAADRPRQKNIGPADTSSLAFAGGSLDYAAPETLRAAMSNSVERAAVSPAVDMWAYGVCVYAMVVGSRPFSHSFRPLISAAILAGDWDRGALLERGGQDALELVQHCLEMDPESRWDADEVLSSAWLRDLARANAEPDDTFRSYWKL